MWSSIQQTNCRLRSKEKRSIQSRDDGDQKAWLVTSRTQPPHVLASSCVYYDAHGLTFSAVAKCLLLWTIVAHSVCLGTLRSWEVFEAYSIVPILIERRHAPPSWPHTCYNKLISGMMLGVLLHLTVCWKADQLVRALFMHGNGKLPDVARGVLLHSTGHMHASSSCQAAVRGAWTRKRWPLNSQKYCQSFKAVIFRPSC